MPKKPVAPPHREETGESEGDSIEGREGAKRREKKPAETSRDSQKEKEEGREDEKRKESEREGVDEESSRVAPPIKSPKGSGTRAGEAESERAKDVLRESETEEKTEREGVAAAGGDGVRGTPEEMVKEEGKTKSGDESSLLARGGDVGGGRDVGGGGGWGWVGWGKSLWSSVSTVTESAQALSQKVRRFCLPHSLLYTCVHTSFSVTCVHTSFSVTCVHTSFSVTCVHTSFAVTCAHLHSLLLSFCIVLTFTAAGLLWV